MALSRAGGRYNPQGSAGVVRGFETAGIKNLEALDAREREAVAEARQAQLDNDYKLLGEKLNILDSIRKEKSKGMEDVRQSMLRSSRDNAIAGLIAQGITDPVEMIDYLNYDDQGNETGDFTLEEITDALSSLKELRGTGAFKFKEDQVGPLLGAGFSYNDIQAFQEDLNSGAPIDEILPTPPRSFM